MYNQESKHNLVFIWGTCSPPVVCVSLVLAGLWVISKEFMVVHYGEWISDAGDC